MKISIVGSGFVGTATGKGFAKHGHDVVFLDINESKISELRQEGTPAFLPVSMPRLTAI